MTITLTLWDNRKPEMMQIDYGRETWRIRCCFCNDTICRRTLQFSCSCSTRWAPSRRRRVVIDGGGGRGRRGRYKKNGLLQCGRRIRRILSHGPARIHQVVRRRRRSGTVTETTVVARNHTAGGRKHARTHAHTSARSFRCGNRWRARREREAWSAGLWNTLFEIGHTHRTTRECCTIVVGGVRI